MYDASILDAMIDELKQDADYMCIEPDSFPDGLDTEIMTYSALERSWHEAKFTSEREHVTMYIKNHPEQFNIQKYTFPIPNTGHHRWTLDEEMDLEFIREVYGVFDECNMTESFGYQDVLNLLNEKPQLTHINAGIVRNEGLIKSIKEDHEVQ